MQKELRNMVSAFEEFPNINEKENLPFFKIFSNFSYFCPNLFCPFCPFLLFLCPFFEKSWTCFYFLEYVLAAMVNWGKYVTSILFWLLPLQSSRSDGTTMGSMMRQCNDATLIKTTIKHTLRKQTWKTLQKFFCRYKSHRTALLGAVADFHSCNGIAFC